MKRLLLVPFAAGLLPAFFLMLSIQTSMSGSATWKTNPATSDWNHAANWMPQTVPNGATDTASFATSNRTNVFLSANTEVNGIVFNAGASAFTITAGATFALTISGLGITNNSGITQNFGAGRLNINFENAASAGTSTFFTDNGFWQFSGSSSAGTGTFSIEGGRLLFTNTSSAATGTFFTLGSPTFAGSLFFGSESTAGNGTFTTSSSPVTGGFGADTVFFDVATAADGIFFTNGGAFSGLNAAALTVFEQDSTAGNSTLIASSGGGVGGRILFFDDSTGGTARLKVFGNGNLDISHHNAPGVSVGSIQGSGLVFLGALNLTVGSNNRSTTFSGVIQGSGTLTKIGRGKLVLKHRNTYSGGTTVKHGKLFVNNRGASGTGTGPVQVNGGELGGAGIIAGAVTVGTGNGSGAVLAPGYLLGAIPGALTIQSPLTFNGDGIYEMQVNSGSGIADEVIANGVTINSGAEFSFADLGGGTLTLGTVFTVINNTAATSIAGTFSNLPDGSTFTSNGNTYQVNYEGGDGNDLTLTVVP
jgi:autotransporter-associated beta strand protein